MKTTMILLALPMLAALTAMVMVSVSNVFASNKMENVSYATAIDSVIPEDTVKAEPATPATPDAPATQPDTTVVAE